MIPADKGGATAIIDNNRYSSKINAVVYTNKYTKVKNDENSYINFT